MRHARALIAAVTITLVASLVQVAMAAAVVSSPTQTTHLTLVAVGDSITERGSDTHSGWLHAYAEHLHNVADVDTDIVDLGKTGATSGQILDRVQHDQTTRSALAGADLVTYEAGINDFLQARGRYMNGNCGGPDGQDCLREMVASFDAHWDGIVSSVQALAPHAARRAMTIYYSTIGYDTEHGSAAVLGRYLDEMNAHIRAHPGGPVALVYRAFNGPDGTQDPANRNLLLSDGVHPSDRGHIIIATQMTALGFGDLPQVHVTVISPQEAQRQHAGHAKTSGRSWWPVAAVVVAAAVLAAGVSLWRFRGRRPPPPHA